MKQQMKLINRSRAIHARDPVDSRHPNGCPRIPFLLEEFDNKRDDLKTIDIDESGRICGVEHDDTELTALCVGPKAEGWRMRGTVESLQLLR